MKHLKNDHILLDLRRSLRKNQTPTEKLLWRHLRARQMQGTKFFRQYSVGRYILDFYCPEHKIAIELDGSQHLEPAAMKYDEARSVWLKGRGISVKRYPNNQVMENIEDVLEDILRLVTSPTIQEKQPTPEYE